MKPFRRVRTLTLALFASLPALFASPPAAVAKGVPEKPFRIMMLLYRGCEEACEGFRTYLSRHRVPVEYIMRDAAQDKQKIPGFITEAKALKPDLVVTWGTTVTLAAVGTYDKVDPAKHITDLPVMFMAVSQPVDVKVVPNLKSSGRNVTGTLYLLPEETQLKAAKTYRDFKRIGFLYNPAESNSKISLEELRKLAPTLGYALVERTLPLDDNKKPMKDAIPRLVDEMAREKIDLLYQGPDTFLNTFSDLVTASALAHNVPTFAAGEAPVVRSNALLGVVNKYSFVGQFTALQASRILVDRVAPKDIPIEMPRRFSYLVNMRVAKTLQLYPPMSVLDVAEVIH